ncbi:MAG: uncharacterized protein JWO22_3199 [Frankiales bacterium]|nr:uncharacterized protein [Frankiales bacterium]
MRKLLVALVVLVGLLVAADRVTVHYVDKALADRMQESGHLSNRPTVDVEGFPFLTQAFSGRYDRTVVHIKDETRSGLTISRLDVTVIDARIPLSKVRSTTDVPVRDLEAIAVLSYYELGRRSGIAGLTVRAQRGKVKVTGRVAGVSATLAATVRLDGDRVVVSTLRGLLDFSVRIPALPYGLRLKAASAQEDGVHLTASSGPTVLSARSST